MRSSDREPVEQEIEQLVTREERELLDIDEVPQEEKSEIFMRLTGFEDDDARREHAEDLHD